MSKQKIHVAKAIYDFSIDGGAVSVITPAQTETIPSGVIVTDVRCNVTATIVAGGGAAQVAITAGGVTLKAAETLANAEWNATGIVDVIRAGNAAATSTVRYIPIATTSAAAIAVPVTVSPITEGVVEIYVEYYRA